MPETYDGPVDDPSKGSALGAPACTAGADEADSTVPSIGYSSRGVPLRDGSLRCPDAVRDQPNFGGPLRAVWRPAFVGARQCRLIIARYRRRSTHRYRHRIRRNIRTCRVWLPSALPTDHAERALPSMTSHNRQAIRRVHKRRSGRRTVSPSALTGAPRRTSPDARRS